MTSNRRLGTEHLSEKTQGVLCAILDRLHNAKGEDWSKPLFLLATSANADEASAALSQTKKLPDRSEPLYMMSIDDTTRLLSIGDAGAWFDSGWHRVEIGRYVLEPDMTLREITEDERRRIGDLADEHSMRK